MNNIEQLLDPIRERIRILEIATVRGNDFTIIACAEQAAEDSPRLLAALDAVEDLAKYLDALTEGDRHYATLFRNAVTAALEGAS